MSKRILAIDYGLVRTGLAVTDPIQGLALPLKTLTTKAGDLWKQLDSIMNQYEPIETVIGLPLLFDGNDSEQTRKTRVFIERFKERYKNCEVSTLDERLTSRQAERLLAETGLRRKERAKMSDETSAWILLTCFLERKNGITREIRLL
jgi:putative Holliday junction resolvase